MIFKSINYNSPDEEKSKEFADGFEAFGKKLDFKDNPYDWEIERTKYGDWEDGFQFAKNENDSLIYKEWSKKLFWGGAGKFDMSPPFILFPRIGPDGIAAARKADEERRELSRLAKLKEKEQKNDQVE